MGSLRLIEFAELVRSGSSLSDCFEVSCGAVVLSFLGVLGFDFLKKGGGFAACVCGAKFFGSFWNDCCAAVGAGSCFLVGFCQCEAAAFAADDHECEGHVFSLIENLFHVDLDNASARGG